MNNISRPIGGFLALLLLISIGRASAQTVEKAASYNVASVASKRCQQLVKVIYYDQLIRALCLKYMPGRKKVRGTKPYDFTRRIASIIGQPIADTETVEDKELSRLVTRIER